MRFRFRGKVSVGRGEGARYLSLDWVIIQIEEKCGFTPFPGTLNVIVDESVRGKYRAFIDAHDGIAVEPIDSRYAYGKYFQGIINGEVDGGVIVPLVPGYLENLVEVISGVNIREALGLSDGDEVSVKILDQDG